MDALVPVAIILAMVAANALYVAAEFATATARKKLARYCLPQAGVTSQLAALRTERTVPCRLIR